MCENVESFYADNNSSVINFYRRVKFEFFVENNITVIYFLVKKNDYNNPQYVNLL